MHIEDLVSVIIPIYNVEKYVRRCIDSILMQTYYNIELLLIDDGSTDASLAICNEYADKDNRIKVFHQENSGVSVARNVGLDNATGKHVIFVDADDWVSPDSIHEMIVEKEKMSAQLLICEYEKCKDFFVIKERSKEITIRLDKNTAYRKIINPYGFYGSVWAKVFSLDLIREKNIRFDSNLTIGEDLWFVFQYMEYIESFCYNAKKVYYYYENQESALRRKRGADFEKRLDILKVYRKILSMPNIEKEPYYKRVVSIYVRELCDWYCTAYYYKRHDMTLEIKEYIKKYIIIFFSDNTFTIKIKFVAILKCIVPKIMFYLKNKG